MRTELFLLGLHLLSVMLWIGSLASIGLVASYASVDTKVRGQLAYLLYRRCALPAFVLAFTSGFARLWLGWHSLYAKAGWMHTKLTLALVVIVLHHWVGARTRKMALAETNDTKSITYATFVSVLVASAIVFLVLLKTIS